MVIFKFRKYPWLLWQPNMTKSWFLGLITFFLLTLHIQLQVQRQVLLCFRTIISWKRFPAKMKITGSIAWLPWQHNSGDLIMLGNVTWSLLGKMVYWQLFLFFIIELCCVYSIHMWAFLESFYGLPSRQLWTTLRISKLRRPLPENLIFTISRWKIIGKLWKWCLYLCFHGQGFH